MKLEGVASRLRDERASVAAELKVLDSLRRIREQLVEVRSSMKPKQ